MQVVDWHMPLLNDALETRITLSKREAAALQKAQTILGQIRERLAKGYGGDDEAYEVGAAEPWILAESYLGGALSDLKYGNRISLPPFERNGR